MSDCVIVWFRQDLRLADNPALDRARRDFSAIVPVYIHDPDSEGDWAPGAASRWWLYHSLAELDRRLEGRGSRLIVANGDTLEQLDRIRRVTGADAVYWNRRYEPAVVERDRRIKAALTEQGVEAKSFKASLLYEPWELRKADDTPYLVFTPFWKRMQKDWQPLAPCPEPRELPTPKRWPVSADLSDIGLLPDHHWKDKLADAWEPGELAARRRLESFVEDQVTGYASRRDRPDQAGTSRLSPSLHFGELSPGQVVRAFGRDGELPGGQGALSYVREIAWREFSTHLLFHFPKTPGQPLRKEFADFPWRKPSDYADDLAAWQRGRTGIPLVDAGMRELWETGWMHNRVRMVVASFLTKNLLIPWQEGARWFWDTLVDADLGNNTQGWQWTAGCGADAAPYFRIFNPVLQGRKFDPNTDYITRWCPELKELPVRHRHAPWENDEKSFSAPLVDLGQTRRRALAAYQEIRKG